MLGNASFQVIVVSNQRCVSEGLLTVCELDSVNERMCRKLAAAGAVIADGEYCPHDLQPPRDCGRPAPGMLLQASRDHGINLAASWMIGDSDIHIEADREAGCRTARTLRNEEHDRIGAEVLADSLFSAAQQILLFMRSLDDVNRP